MTNSFSFLNWGLAHIDKNRRERVNCGIFAFLGPSICGKGLGLFGIKLFLCAMCVCGGGSQCDTYFLRHSPKCRAVTHFIFVVFHITERYMGQEVEKI